MNGKYCLESIMSKEKIKMGMGDDYYVNGYGNKVIIYAVDVKGEYDMHPVHAANYSDDKGIWELDKYGENGEFDLDPCSIYDDILSIITREEYELNK